MADAYSTKNALAEAMKTLVRQKGFDKVSVGEITGACGMGRQSFYYHFQDKFELLEWIYYQDAFAPLCNGITLQNWPQRLKEMLTVMEQQRKFYISVIKAQDKHFSDCLGHILKSLFLQIIEHLDNSAQIDRERREFGAAFYALGCCAVVVQWAQNGMRMPAEKLAEEIYVLAKNSEQAAARLAEETQKVKQQH